MTKTAMQFAQEKGEKRKSEKKYGRVVKMGKN